MPMTGLAYEAFRDQVEDTPGSDYLFPTTRRGSSKPYIGSLKKMGWSRCGKIGQEGPKLTALLNFFDELRRRVPARRLNSPVSPLGDQ